jgi:hypothetical protein
MATYVQVDGIPNSAAGDPLKSQVRIATMVAAQNIIALGAAMTAAQRAWAQSVLTNLEYESHRMFLAVLAANVAQPLASITGASDATVQTAVNAAVPLFTS